MAMPKALSSIYNQISSKILLSGPIPVAEYMKIALTSQVSAPLVNASNLTSGGYYMHKDVFGAHGDFITSPEISQMFGEMIGIWAIETCRRIGGPRNMNIVELGPGRGTLSKDILRVYHQVNKKEQRKENFELHLVEISPYLAKLQYETLCGPIDKTKFGNLENLSGPMLQPISTTDTHFFQGVTNDGSSVPVHWHRQLSTVPKAFNFYIAHEFFDALPIHKLRKVNDLWREVLVDNDSPLPSRVNVSGNPNGGDSEAKRGSDKEKFRFVISRHETPVIQLLKSCYPSILADSRQDLEFSVEGAVLYDQLTKRLEEDGGIVLVVDYGHDGSKGDTFRGFYRHQLHDPLEQPGLADMTADVDFSIVRKLTNDKAMVCGPITQAELLSRLGISVRLKTLYDQCTKAEDRKQLVSGYKMLMEDMGSRFKCLALFPKILEEFRPHLKITAFDHD